MAETFASRFTLKRSASVDTIVTNADDGDQSSKLTIVDRIRFSHLLKRAASASNLYRGQIDTKNKSKIEDEKLPSQKHEKSIDVKNETNIDIEVSDLDRHNHERISLQSPLKRGRKAPLHYTTAKCLPICNDVNSAKNKLQRRRSSYSNEYFKRESDRIKAREVSATLIRAQKVRKEFNDKAKPERSSMNNNRRVRLYSERDPAHCTNKPSIPTISDTKIRLHATSMPFTLQANTSPLFLPPAVRNTRRNTSDI